MLKGQSWQTDQATALRALTDHEHRDSTLSIAVTSGKGGVGKTNVAVNMAVMLARRGLKVTIMDLDLGLANVDMLINLHSTKNLSHVVSGDCSIEQVIVDGPAGVRVIPGASGLERLANLSEFERHRLLTQFMTIEHYSDVMIMDLGAGVSRNVLQFAGATDVALVVTTPEPTALTDAYSTIKLLSHNDRNCDIEVVVNQAQSRKEAKQTYERIAGVASRFLNIPVTYAGYVLVDHTVGEAVRARHPFVLFAPHGSATACIKAIASKFARRVDVASENQGFFSRLAQMFM